MKNTMTNEQAWNWLGNRGISVYKHNVRVRGIWAFVRYPDWERVDYYHLDANGSAEPMDSIRLDASPFAANSKAKVDATVERITEQFYKDYPEELTGSCLVAISGDCAGAMINGQVDVLPFDDKHQPLVIDFLRAQFEFHSYSHFNNDSGLSRLYTKFHDAFLALKDADVFKHKWHFRTEWKLAYLSEVAEQENQ